MLYGHSHTVAVRIRGNEKIRIRFFAVFQRHLKCRRFLRIGVRAGGEITVRFALLRHKLQIVYPHILKDAADTA